MSIYEILFFLILSDIQTEKINNLIYQFKYLIWAR
jgi:hypothetical protein